MTDLDDALASLDELPEETVVVDSAQLDRDAMPYDLGAFARVVMPLSTGEQYIDGWWLEDLREHLMWFAEELKARRAPRLMIEGPPRHGKSLFLNLLASWLLAFVMRGRKFEIMVVSATRKASGDRSRESRKIMRALMASGLVPGLSFDKETEFEWTTNEGGSFYAVGVDGTIVSQGADFIAIDDIVKGRAQVITAGQREKTWRTYTGNIRDRLMPGGAIMWSGTRWHRDDAQGRALEGSAHEGWKRLTYRAISEGAADLGRPAGDTRQDGEPLHDHPLRYPLEALESVKKTVTTADWQARYQQRPIVEGGGIWKRKWWSYHSAHASRPDDLPEPEAGELEARWQQTPEQFERIMIAADYTMGSQTGKGSFAVIQRWGILDGCAYLLTQRRGRWGSTESSALLVMEHKAAMAEHPGVRVIVIVEEKALGIDVIRELSSRLPGIVRDKSKGSKELKAEGSSAHIEHGRAFLPHGAQFLHEMLEEFTDFPSGTTDDQVDTAGMVLRRLTVRRKPRFHVAT